MNITCSRNIAAYDAMNNFVIGTSNITIGYDVTRKIRQCEECTVIIIFKKKAEIIALDKNFNYAEIKPGWPMFVHKRPYNCVHNLRVNQSLKICEKMFPRWFELYKIFFTIGMHEASKDIFSHLLTFYSHTLTD